MAIPCIQFLPSKVHAISDPVKFSLILMINCSSSTVYCYNIEHFTSLQHQQTETLQTAQDQKTLISQLEADLSKVRPFLAVHGEVEGQATSSSAEFMFEALRDVQGEGPKSNLTSAVVGGADSLLPIVSSQRERFKQRNMELEAVSMGNKAVSIG